MRVIFLDIDGVLNHPGTWSAWDRATMDLQRSLGLEPLPIPVEAACMARLNRVVAATGAKIVISSSWRLHARWQDLGPALARRGLAGEVVGETPVPPNFEGWPLRIPRPAQSGRGREIAAWLASHPEVEAFVILDDDPDTEPLTAHHVHTIGFVGLTDEDAARAVAILSAPRAPEAPGGDR